LKSAWIKPLIATIHATEYGRNDGIHNNIQKYIHQIENNLTYEAWRVITCSEFMKNEVIKIFDLPQDKVISIPNGINKDKYKINFDKKSFRRNYAGDDEKIIFYVGRMVREKGVDVLIDAIPNVLQKFPSAKFLIVGGGYTEHLKQKARDLGIYHKTFFTGYVDDETLLKIYNIIDVAVFPSLYEPFGIVALEAMAAKVPVVVSDIGGFREIVNHNTNGIWTWANNSSSIAWGILQVLKNKNLSYKLVNNAFKKTKDIYNWEKIAKKTKELYETVIDEYLVSGWKKTAKSKRE
jgi:glycosyltransferase involved in cell wall biosynthesis